MSHSPGFYNYESPNAPQPPQPEEPAHDVPTFPPEDSPPGTETALRLERFDSAVGFESPGRPGGPGERESPGEGQDDVDDDDLDPQVPHSPPDGKKGRIVFDENGAAG